MQTWKVLTGDVREKLREIPDQSVQCCVTSPPYFNLRDYGQEGQIGLEEIPGEFVAALVDVFDGVRRVLSEDGTLWLNLGDSYAGSWGAQGRPQGATGEMATRSVISARQIAAHPKLKSRTGTIGADWGCKPKDLIGIPWMVAFALRSAGWYLRCDVIWSKPNPMPESVTDRPTKAHEYVFLLSKSERYYYNADAIRERAVKVGTVAHLAGGSGKRAGSREGLRRDEWIARKSDQEVSGHPLYSKPYEGKARKDYDAGGAQNPSDVKRRIVDKILSGELEGRNCRSVWNFATRPYPDAHFATFPEELPTRCILAGSRPGDLILDPFTGSGTTGAVALKLGRSFIGVELNPAYVQLAEKRIGSAAPLFSSEASA